MPLSSQTTTRSHYKSWQPSPAKPYSEMPAVVGKKNIFLILFNININKFRKKNRLPFCLPSF